jgi:hypothetical protein
MGWNLLILLAILFAYGVFSYMSQKSTARKAARHERLKERHDALMDAIKNKKAEDSSSAT